MNLSKLKNKTGTAAIYIVAIMLVALGYWNYISVESNNIQTVAQTSDENQQDENLGDAQLVSNNEVINPEESVEVAKDTKEENNYFEESKLERDKMYSQTLETYKEILNNSNVSEEQKAIVTQEITDLNKEKNAIMISENLIMTKGFSNCVIFVNIDSVSVVVENKELKTDEIAQIQNIISREIGVKMEQIHIMTRQM